MSGLHWNRTVMLGKGVGYDAVSCLLSPMIKRPQFFQWEEGHLFIISREEACKTSFVARLILAQQGLEIRHRLISWSIPLTAWLLVHYSMRVIYGIFRAIFYRSHPLVVTLAAYGAMIFFRSLSLANEIENTGYRIPLRKQPKSLDIARRTITAPAPFHDLPTELLFKILKLVEGKVQDLNNFRLTCTWATNFCWRAAFEFRLQALESLLPASLLKLMNTTLGHNARLNPTEIHVPHYVQRTVFSYENTRFPPGTTNYWSGLLGDYPQQWPIIYTPHHSVQCAPFVLAHARFLKNYKISYMLTGLNTPAFFFVYKCSLDDKARVLILTKIPPLVNEWFLFEPPLFDPPWNDHFKAVNAFSALQNGQPVTFERLALLPKATKIAFDEDGDVTPQCQQVWEWFAKFLAGEQVLPFYSGKPSPYDHTNDPGYFLQLVQNPSSN